MAREIIDIGTTGNDGTGDDLRTGAIKINNNFQELYADVGVLKAATGDSIDGIGFVDRGIQFEGDSPDDAYETLLKVINPTADRTIYLPDESGTVALLSNITDIVDSAYISLLTGTAFDSGSTLILIQANSIDSAEAIALIDSAYIQLRQDFAYSSLTGAPTVLDSAAIQKFTLDSAATIQLIDSAYVQARQTSIRDSAFITSIVDSAYVNNLATANLDSAEVIALVDSDYVKARATEVDLNTYTVSTVPAGSHGKLIFVNDGASGSPCLAVYDSAAGFYKRIALGTQIST